MEQEDRYSRLTNEQNDLKASLTVTLYDNQDFYYKKLEKGFGDASFFEVQARESESLQLLDDFYTTPDLNKEKKITLKCTYDDMIYYPKNNLFEQNTIFQEDLIGAEVKMKGKEANKMYAHELIIILYEKQVPGCFSSMGRKRRDIVFYHHDIEKLLIWKNLMCYIAKDKKYLETKQRNFKRKKIDLFDFTFLVFVNPASGKGHAEKVWSESKALLKLAGYQFDEIRTQRRNHARDVILEMEADQLYSYCGIITVSGDGLPHEVLQALGTRDDAEKALKIGLAALPGGSGNALARNVAGRSQEQPDTLGATYIIIKSQKLSIDLLELTLTKEDQERNEWPTNKIFSFLSICCSYLADVDLNSEHLRFLGELRFDVQGFIRAVCQKHINIEVQVKHKDQQQNQYSPPQQNQYDEESKEEDFEIFKGKCKYLQFQNMPYISTNNYTAPVSEMNDGFLDLQLIMNQSWSSLLCQAIDFQQGDQFTSGKDKKPVRKSLTHRMCTEFKIKNNDDGYILFSVDGERYDCKSISGKVHPQSFNIFCTK